MRYVIVYTQSHMHPIPSAGLQQVPGHRCFSCELYNSTDDSSHQYMCSVPGSQSLFMDVRILQIFEVQHPTTSGKSPLSDGRLGC